MDRISALRNVEHALRAFEAGEADLAETERRVGTVLRTFATEFEEGGTRAYRTVAASADGDAAHGDANDAATAGNATAGAAGDGSDGGDRRGVGTVVVADSPAEARERVAALTGRTPADVEVEPLD